MTIRTEMVKHLYLHVPFCRSICHYCDFMHRLYDEDIVNRWLDSLERELEYRNINKDMETIYIGGGTPSCLSYFQTERLFKLLEPYINNPEEFTVEVNPESVNAEKASLFKKYGVNRISVGVQSFNDDLLKTIGRRHDSKRVYEALDILRNNGFDNISCDLMYSLPGQSLEMFEDDLRKLVSLKIPHISLYSLQIEEGTVFKARGIKPLDEETEAEMYERAVSYLKSEGYVHYEISNFSLPGKQSRHNLGYWNYEDFYGISMGASGKENHVRYDNVTSFKEYFEGKYIREEISLSKEDEMFENVMMSLRTVWGINIEDFNRKYDCDFLKRYEKGINNPAIEVKDGNVRCIRPEILNTVLLDFMD